MVCVEAFILGTFTAYIAVSAAIDQSNPWFLALAAVAALLVWLSLEPEPGPLPPPTDDSAPGLSPEPESDSHPPPTDDSMPEMSAEAKKALDCAAAGAAARFQASVQKELDEIVNRPVNTHIKGDISHVHAQSMDAN